jgi:hypothetical protein
VRPDLPTYAQLRARTDAPPGSSWGVFGASDEVGALNLLTADKVLAASRLVRKGAVFSLDHPVNAFPPNRMRPPACHTVLEIAPDWRDDYLDSFYLQQTSQIDGLRHVRHSTYGFYGGAPVERLTAGDPTLGVNRWADRGVVGRGVLIDVARYRQQAGAPLDHRAGEPITVAMLEEVLAAQGTALRPGDMLLLRTDYPNYLRSLEGSPPTSSAGLEQSLEMLAWLWDNRIPLAASDNNALECGPAVPTSPFCTSEVRAGNGLMHAELIAMLGIVVGELWRLDELADDCAADGVYDCMLIVKPLNVIGGVGSPPNATAIK